MYLLFSFLLSLVVVGFGVPSWQPSFGVIASVCGYALFWKAVLEMKSKKSRFFVALIWYACVQIVQLSWMTAVEYQGSYMILLLFLFSFAMGSQFGLLTAFLPFQRPISLLEKLFLAGFWVLLEWSRLFFLSGFTWNFSGMALSSTLWSLQFASLFGIFGLSFWVFFTNLNVLDFLQRKEFSFRKIAALAVIALVPYCFGGARLLLQHFEDEGEKITVGLVQTNYLPPEKIPLENFPKRFVTPINQWEEILSYFEKQNMKYDLLVMPEAVVPFGFDPPIYLFSEVSKVLKSKFGEQVEKYFPPLQFPYGTRRRGLDWVSNAFFAQTISNYKNTELIAGFDYFDPESDNFYNSAFHFFPGQKKINRYDKQKLIPIAECLPFQWCKKIAGQYGINNFFTPGAEQKIFSGNVPMGISICYEETFSSFMHQSYKNGAKLFVNLTNDDWYPESKLFEQHLYHARIRAVENGIPLVRSCNGGISALIDPFGRILQKQSKNTKGIVSNEIEIKTFHTFYQLFGDVGAVAISILFFVIFGLVSLKKRLSLKEFKIKEASLLKR